MHPNINDASIESSIPNSLNKKHKNNESKKLVDAIEIFEEKSFENSIKHMLNEIKKADEN